MFDGTGLTDARPPRRERAVAHRRLLFPPRAPAAHYAREVGTPPRACYARKALPDRSFAVPRQAEFIREHRLLRVEEEDCQERSACAFTPISICTVAAMPLSHGQRRLPFTA